MGMTLSQAVRTGQIGKVFRDTFSTYLLKFPVFEVINAILAFTALPGQVRGICNGFLYCTITLPSTNCRYSKSMGLEIKPSLLYQAYLPTLARDIVYGWSREFMGSMLMSTVQPGSMHGEVICFGITIFAASVLSSPCNEWRGYTLLSQRKGTKKRHFNEYFRPVNYLRSTAISSSIMEPLVSGLITKRMTLSQAVRTGQIGKVFRDTFSTYLLKFPVFEVINAILAFTALPGQVRG